MKKCNISEFLQIVTVCGFWLTLPFAIAGIVKGSLVAAIPFGIVLVVFASLVINHQPNCKDCKEKSRRSWL